MELLVCVDGGMEYGDDKIEKDGDDSEGSG